MFTGHEILHLDGVADGKYVRVAGVHLVIDEDAAALADGDACGVGQLGVGTHADGENHHVGRVGIALFRLHLDSTAFNLFEAVHTVIGNHLDPMAFDVALHQTADLRVQWCQDMVRLLDEGHIEAPVDEVLGAFESNESAANDHRTGGGFRLLNAGITTHAG